MENHLEILKNIKGRWREIIYGRIMYKCGIGYATMFRRLQDGFKPMEQSAIFLILAEYPDVVQAAKEKISPSES